MEGRALNREIEDGLVWVWFACVFFPRATPSQWFIINTFLRIIDER